MDAALRTALDRYVALLINANRATNLTSVSDPAELWERHILDSLTALPRLADLPRGARVVDVGSGGGLPGIPIALARPDLLVWLIESRRKKARELRQFLETLDTNNAHVVLGRAEVLGHDTRHRETYDVALCRAVGPLTEILEYAMPLIRVGGRLVAHKGAGARGEVEPARDALGILGAATLALVDTDSPTVLVEVTKHAPTPDAFPRRPGRARKSPL